MRKTYLLGLLYFALSLAGLALQPRGAHEPIQQTSVGVDSDEHDEIAEWFHRARGHCNSVEALTWIRANPAPDGPLGVAHAAACFALAGRVDFARSQIVTLPDSERWKAAGLVFDLVHPAADAGDEVAAGPAMELVVEFWPNHYMALYHAGASRYQRGEDERAAQYLNRFLAEYRSEDGWRRSALDMLEGMRSR